MLRICDGIFRDAYRVLVLALAVHFDLQLLAQCFQLVDSGRAVYVGCGEQHALALLADVVAELSAEGGLTGTL